jgi:hypothetical protein
MMHIYFKNGIILDVSQEIVNLLVQHLKEETKKPIAAFTDEEDNVIFVIDTSEVLYIR